MTRPDKKQSNVRQFLCEAFLKNEFLKSLEVAQIEEIVTFMQYKQYDKNDMIITQGDVGEYTYVIEKGKVNVLKFQQFRRSLSKGSVFGELAILYGCPRTASVQAAEDCDVWSIDRVTFQTVLMTAEKKRQSKNLNFLNSLNIFRGRSPEEKGMLADALEENHYQYGDYIIRQGRLNIT